MEQLSKKYSLDWLVTGSNAKAAATSAASIGESAPLSAPFSSSARPRAASPLDEAVILFSDPIRMALQESGNQMRLHELVEKVNQKRKVEEFEQFVGVVNYLRDLGFVAYADKDLRGNHMVKLLK